MDENSILNLYKWSDENNIGDLDENGMGIPRDFNILNEIEELDLSAMGIKVLPKEIGLLTNLISLDLNLNELESIPNEIGCLENLEFLSLGVESEFIDLPESIKNLTNLKYLTLTGNFSLKSFDLIKDLPITHLTISYNKILKSLEEDYFINLSKLIDVELSQVNNLELSKKQYEYLLRLRKQSFVYIFDSKLKKIKTDVGVGFKYFSYIKIYK